MHCFMAILDKSHVTKGNHDFVYVEVKNDVLVVNHKDQVLVVVVLLGYFVLKLGLEVLSSLVLDYVLQVHGSNVKHFLDVLVVKWHSGTSCNQFIY